MGVAWYISIERELAGLDTLVDGKSIAHVSEGKLAAIFEKLGVRPLMEFFSISPDELAGLLGDDEDGVDMSTTPEEEWFSAEEGLATVRPVLNYLQQNEGELENQQYVMTDLEQYERILAAVAEEGVGWHLAIDI